MKLALDSFDILRRIGSNPELFSAQRGAVAEMAETLVKKELTSKALDLDTFRALVDALGDDNVALILQTLDPSAVLAIVRSLDPHHAKLKTRNAAWAERRLMDLALGRAKPVPRAAPRARSKAKALRAPVRVKRASPFGTGAMGASTGDRDPD